MEFFDIKFDETFIGREDGSYDRNGNFRAKCTTVNPDSSSMPKPILVETGLSRNVGESKSGGLKEINRPVTLNNVKIQK